MKLRAWGLLGSAALHLAAGLVWLRDPTPTTPGPAARSTTLVSLRLLAPPSPTPVAEAAPMPPIKTSPSQGLAAPPKVTATPALSSLAVRTTLAVAATAAPIEAIAHVPTVASTMAPATPPAPSTPLATAAAATEADYRAATPPDRACTDRNVARLYPPLLRERGIEGQVVLRVRVDEKGHAAEVIVHGGSGWRLLDEAARLMTQGCSFVPARRGEQALASWVEYPVRFALNGAAQ